MKTKRSIYVGFGFLAVFSLWTFLLCTVDVKGIGPSGSCVGFAEINGYVHSLTGVHMILYHITDWMGLIPVAIMLGFATLGAIQWIRRRHFTAVDHDILLLGGFYLIVLCFYFLFEYVVINYRPIRINGYLEASYPSSTTLLVLCVMPTAIIQFDHRIQSRFLRKGINIAIQIFTLFMVVGRLLSGVHWLTDIIGGILLSMGLVLLYHGIYLLIKNTDPRH